MEVARPLLTAGVALVGAGAIAVSPLAPPPAVHDITASDEAVHLTAIADPFGPVFDATRDNIEALVTRIAANPTPILSQVIANQLHSAQVLGGIGRDYVTNLANYLTGDHSGSLHAQLALVDEYLETGSYGMALAQLSAIPVSLLAGGNVFGIFDVIADVVTVVQQPFANTSAALGVLTDPRNLVPLGLAMVLTINDTAMKFGQGLEGIEDAVETGGVEDVINAALVGAANTLNSLQSGVVGPTGIVSSLRTLGDQIAAAIVPTAAPAVASARTAPADELPSTPASVVSLRTGEGTSEQAGSASSAGAEVDAEADAEPDAGSAQPEQDSEAENVAAGESSSVDKHKKLARSGIKNVPSRVASLIRKSLHAKPTRAGATAAGQARDAKAERVADTDTDTSSTSDADSASGGESD